MDLSIFILLESSNQFFWDFFFGKNNKKGFFSELFPKYISFKGSCSILVYSKAVFSTAAVCSTLLSAQNLFALVFKRQDFSNKSIYKTFLDKINFQKPYFPQ